MKHGISTPDGLLNYPEVTLALPQGLSSVITINEDYHEADGILHSFTQIIKMPDRTRTTPF